MKKLAIILSTIILAGGLVGGCVLAGKESSNSDKNTATGGRVEVKWKEGFTKTEWDTYIPDSFDVLYKTLKNDEMYQEMEEGFKRKIIFNREETNELIAKMNKTTPQDYPLDAMLSPFSPDTDKYPYVNTILFIPNTTLDKTTNSNLGLTKVQYQAIRNDILKYQYKVNEEDISKPYQTEVMEMSCKLSQVPMQIQTLTKMPIIQQQYLPELRVGSKDTLEVLYPRSIKTNLNSSYLHVMNKDGGCVSYSGTYDKAGKLVEEANTIPVKQVDRIIYLFFVHDRNVMYSEDDIGGSRMAFIYHPKLAVFNIVQ